MNFSSSTHLGWFKQSYSVGRSAVAGIELKDCWTRSSTKLGEFLPQLILSEKSETSREKELSLQQK